MWILTSIQLISFSGHRIQSGLSRETVQLRSIQCHENKHIDVNQILVVSWANLNCTANCLYIKHVVFCGYFNFEVAIDLFAASFWKSVYVNLYVPFNTCAAMQPWLLPSWRGMKCFSWRQLSQSSAKATGHKRTEEGREKAKKSKHKKKSDLFNVKVRRTHGRLLLQVNSQEAMVVGQV